MKQVLKKINNNESKIGIVGLGYVGLPLSISFSNSGFKVYGFDIDKMKILSLKNRKSYIAHIDDKKIISLINQNFSVSSEFFNISKCDVIIVCVPTPLGSKNNPDLTFINSTLESIKPYLKENQLFILESTTFPGTTDEIIVPSITLYNNNVSDKKNLLIGKNFFVGYSPEREDPGNEKYTTNNIPKIVSGVTNNCLKLTDALYSQIVKQTVPVSSPKVAEMTKITENIYRAVNIGLMNELKIFSDKIDIDIFEVLDAAKTKPFGFDVHYPGPGIGGHCIPVDPYYLIWKAKKFGMNTKLVELAANINKEMPTYVINKIKIALNSIGKSFLNSKVLILGLSYKKNVDDCRESPSLVIIDMLLKKKTRVDYSDPYVDKIPLTRKFNLNLFSIELTKENIRSYDLVVLLTDHDLFDYRLIENESNLIVDTRNKFKNNSEIIKA